MNTSLQHKEILATRIEKLIAEKGWTFAKFTSELQAKLIEKAPEILANDSLYEIFVGKENFAARAKDRTEREEHLSSAIEKLDPRGEQSLHERSFRTKWQNAYAIYLGYKDFQDFENSTDLQEKTDKNTVAEIVPGTFSKHNNALNKFLLNQTFYLYSFEKLNNAPCLDRAVLRIGSTEDDVRVDNSPQQSRRQNYSGYIRLIKDNFVLIALRYEDSEEFTCHIKVAINTFRKAKYYPGGYLAVHHNEMVCGTVFLQRLSPDETPLKPDSLLFDNPAHRIEVNDYIWTYFKRKSQNRLDIPVHVSLFSEHEIRDFIAKKKLEEISLVKKGLGNNWIYIATPMHDPGVFDQVHEIADYLKKQFSTQGLESSADNAKHFSQTPAKPVVYAPILDYGTADKVRTFGDGTIAAKSFEHIKKSDKFILVYPTPSNASSNVNAPSSTLVELGMAVMEGMKIYIYCENRDDLPGIIRGATASGRIRVLEQISLEEIKTNFLALSEFFFNE